MNGEDFNCNIVQAVHKKTVILRPHRSFVQERASLIRNNSHHSIQRKGAASDEINLVHRDEMKGGTEGSIRGSKIKPQKRRKKNNFSRCVRA
jgi:hypothetical protein